MTVPARWRSTFLGSNLDEKPAELDWHAATPYVRDNAARYEAFHAARVPRELIDDGKPRRERPA